MITFRLDKIVINHPYKSQVQGSFRSPSILILRLKTYGYRHNLQNLLPSSNAGDKVMDMFLDGFTTARVTLQLGREPLGFEINKKAFGYFYPRFNRKR